MKKPLETYLAFIENELGCKLFDWQKDVLRYAYNGERLYYHGARGCGMTMLDKAVIILCMAMEEDNQHVRLLN